MRVAFFEDEHVSDLSPIALLRPAFELVCGQFSLVERILRRFDVSSWGAFVRPELAEVLRESYPEAHINDSAWLQQDSTLLLNGRWLPAPESLTEFLPGETGFINGEIVSITLSAEESVLLEDSAWSDALTRLANDRTPTNAQGCLVQFPWDLVDHNPTQLIADFRQRSYLASDFEFGPQVAILGEPHDIHIDPRAQIDPFVVLDARTGPIAIDADAILQPFTRIEGPCYVGRGSQLFRANVRGGTTIGPMCRVGGEVEASILHSHVNKYHDGFLGHSYVCPWVNLGAQTTNSDLKNDYSAVRVPVDGRMIDSGSTKIGCFIGDHTKTALGSLFNTGSSIGVMCMVLPAGELLPKHVASFSRIWHGIPDDAFDLEAGLATARTAMGRRNCELTEAQERLLRTIHAKTQEERNATIAWFHKKARRSADPVTIRKAIVR